MGSATTKKSPIVPLKAASKPGAKVAMPPRPASGERWADPLAWDDLPDPPAVRVRRRIEPRHVIGDEPHVPSGSLARIDDPHAAGVFARPFVATTVFATLVFNAVWDHEPVVALALALAAAFVVGGLNLFFSRQHVPQVTALALKAFLCFGGAALIVGAWLSPYIGRGLFFLTH